MENFRYEIQNRRLLTWKLATLLKFIMTAAESTLSTWTSTNSMYQSEGVFTAWNKVQFWATKRPPFSVHFWRASRWIQFWWWETNSWRAKWHGGDTLQHLFRLFRSWNSFKRKVLQNGVGKWHSRRGIKEKVVILGKMSYSENPNKGLLFDPKSKMLITIALIATQNY